MVSPDPAFNTPHTLTSQQLADYEQAGYLVVRGLFDAQEVQAIRAHFDELAAKGEPIPGHWEPTAQTPADGGGADPLARYPRVLHPHRFSALAQRYMLDRRVQGVLRGLLGEEPIACQSMFYFKPTGSRGQAFHQDNLYLRVKPHNCIAAWTAVDRSFPDNGGLFVCPGTHRMELACPEQADLSESFTGHLVRPPAGIEPVPVELEPGDVLFFNGSVVHGSHPNRSREHWRRSFICHYMPHSGREVANFYRPLLDFDGNEVCRDEATGGGPCGDEAKAPH